jgi:hypothetical protein
MPPSVPALQRGARRPTNDAEPHRDQAGKDNRDPFHRRIQPVILVSEDGRSATTRIRNLQYGTSRGMGAGFNGGMYHNQFVLEDQDRCIVCSSLH